MKPIYFLLAFSLAACGAKNEEYTNESGAAYTEAKSMDMVRADEAAPVGNAAAMEADMQSSPQLPDVVVPKLIRNADLRFQVESLEKSSEIIDQLTKQYSAYVSTANMSSTNSESNNTITIRVPNTQFEPLLKEICKQSIYMQRKNVSTQDVTEEYVDIEARLKTKKEVEARYVEILKSKAKTVEDVLKAEEQIRIIREEIEAREGRLNYLKNQVSYSTISVQVYQQIEYSESPQEVTESFGNKAKTGFGQGWEVIQDFVIGLITIWPLWVLGAIVFYLIRRRIKRARAK